MPIGGNCQICEKFTHALVTCMFCGAIVCTNCFDSRTGACKRCKSKPMKG